MLRSLVLPSLALLATLPTCSKDVNSPVDHVGISLGLRGMTEMGLGAAESARQFLAQRGCDAGAERFDGLH